MNSRYCFDDNADVTVLESVLVENDLVFDNTDENETRYGCILRAFITRIYPRYYYESVVIVAKYWSTEEIIYTCTHNNDNIGLHDYPVLHGFSNDPVLKNWLSNEYQFDTMNEIDWNFFNKNLKFA